LAEVATLVTPDTCWLGIGNRSIFLVSISDQVRRLEGISRRTRIGETSPDMRIRAAV
jgi:hypothetical protein